VQWNTCFFRRKHPAVSCGGLQCGLIYTSTQGKLVSIHQ
jgi:hypothetical protein